MTLAASNSVAAVQIKAAVSNSTIANPETDALTFGIGPDFDIRMVAKKVPNQNGLQAMENVEVSCRNSDGAILASFELSTGAQCDDVIRKLPEHIKTPFEIHLQDIVEQFDATHDDEYVDCFVIAINEKRKKPLNKKYMTLMKQDMTLTEEEKEEMTKKAIINETRLTEEEMAEIFYPNKSQSAAKDKCFTVTVGDQLCAAKGKGMFAKTYQHFHLSVDNHEYPDVLLRFDTIRAWARKNYPISWRHYLGKLEDQEKFKSTSEQRQEERLAALQNFFNGREFSKSDLQQLKFAHHVILEDDLLGELTHL